jgi:hypothetical protein
MIKRTALPTRVAAFALLAALGSSCQSVREGSDLGHRIIDRDRLPPAKLFGYVGAVAGYAVGFPVMIALLPTYPFERLQYRSGPDHDLEMPILFAPVEICGGIGALVAGGPFRLMDQAIHGPETPVAPAGSAPSVSPSSAPVAGGR